LAGLATYTQKIVPPRSRSKFLTAYELRRQMRMIFPSGA
jgi:hypothetical protein